MLTASKRSVLRVNALRIEQQSDALLFVFGVDGRRVHQFASVDAAGRDSDGVLQGYQRERVQGHINAIYRYLAREDAILPNAIVLAFADDVAFTVADGVMETEWGTVGSLQIPLPRRGEPKPAQIVDGQQRVSALAMLDPTRTFPVVVVGFQVRSEEARRLQFVLVNRTKPLPRDLLNELLPHVTGGLPPLLARRRVSGQVLELVRFDRKSPFFGRVRGLGNSGEGSNIASSSVLGLIEASVRRGGVLAEGFYESDPPDIDRMALNVQVFFDGVRRTWPEAWEASPWSSRLVHGVGMASLGVLMDVVMAEVSADRPRAVASVERRLSRLKNRCAWTEGRWPVLGCAWNELQNTSQDKRRLSAYLLGEYQRGGAV
jgi:DGQHR domain-containing protein